MKTEFNGFYVSRPVAMLESPAFRVLSRAALLILARLEIEFSRHKRVTNGQLLVTYADFEAFGIHHHAIGPALRELEALGFIEVVQQGSAGNAGHRQPNLYRATYLLGAAGNAPTNEWRNIKTIDDAETIAAEARKAKIKCPNTKVKFMRPTAENPQ